MAILNTGPEYTSRKGSRRKPRKHTITSMILTSIHARTSLYEHCRNNDDDWRSKSKEELQAIVGELSNV